MKHNQRILLMLTLLLFTIAVWAQSRRTITGRVTDNAGGPVPLATVTVKGTSTSTVSDESGRFSITVEQENAVLVISSAGFGTREIPVGSAATLDVTLQPAGDLEGVVVTALGISREKKPWVMLPPLSRQKILYVPVLPILLRHCMVKRPACV